MRGKVTYVPGYPGTSKSSDKSMKYFWWRDDNISGYRHPAVLLSAPYFVKNSRSDLLIGDDVLVVGDSGGFQILTGKIDWLEPITILRWQEENCDIGITLDVPPVSSISSIPDISFVEKCARKSARNYEIAARNRRNDKLLLLKPLHGAKLEQLKIWHKRIKDIDLDGYALSPKPAADPMIFALHTIFIHEAEMPERIHVFLGSGSNIIPVIIYSSYFFKNVTFDSTTPLLRARNRCYIISFVPVTFYIRMLSRETLPSMKRLPCDCPVCSKISSAADFYKEINNGERFLELHNLFITLRYIHTLDALCDCRDSFHEYVRVFCSDETLKAIEMMMYYEEGHSVSECYEKFSAYFRFNRCQKPKQDRLL